MLRRNSLDQYRTWHRSGVGRENLEPEVHARIVAVFVERGYCDAMRVVSTAHRTCVTRKHARAVPAVKVHCAVSVPLQHSVRCASTGHRILNSTRRAVPVPGLAYSARRRIADLTFVGHIDEHEDYCY
eukprot:1366130-Rhodomonas_salina.5